MLTHQIAPPLSGIKEYDDAANFAEFLKKRKPATPQAKVEGRHPPAVSSAAWLKSQGL